MANFDASTPQLKTVKNLFDAVSSFDLSKVLALLSKNYQYEAFNGATDLAKLDGEEYAKATQGFFAGVTKLDITCHEVIEAPGKVVVQASVLSKTASGATLPYDTVGIISLEEEDGELKITSVKDFPDPQKRSAFIAGAFKAAAERGSAS